jgi:DNA-binding MarR family transcriptional regulator
METPLGAEAPQVNGRFPAPSAGPTEDWLRDIERPPMGSVVGMLFRATVDRVQVHMVARQGEPVRPSHLYVLRSLYPVGTSVSELADRCEVTKQAISQVTDSLESAGLVRRTSHPTDGRVRIVELTEHGRHTLETAVLAWGDVEREWAELLGGPDVMQRVREAMLAFVESYGDWHRGEEPRLRPVW